MAIKIPKHGGPDGQGLQEEVIDELIDIINKGLFTEEQQRQAIELCISASTQEQWNNNYRLKLLEIFKI
jgi:hypothetical protein